MTWADDATTVEPRTASERESLGLGGDDRFVLAYVHAEAALRSRARYLVLSTLVNVSLAVAVMYLAWRNEQKETYVFVRNAYGELVQADAKSFLHAGDTRTEDEVKSFMRRWVVDAFTWTPLDVEDRIQAALRVVDGRAQPIVKSGMRLSPSPSLVAHMPLRSFSQALGLRRGLEIVEGDVRELTAKRGPIGPPACMHYAPMEMQSVGRLRRSTPTTPWICSTAPGRPERSGKPSLRVRPWGIAGGRRPSRPAPAPRRR
jgi:hypothetical protein